MTVNQESALSLVESIAIFWFVIGLFCAFADAFSWTRRFWFFATALLLGEAAIKIFI